MMGNMKKGQLIVIEGTDGSGKGTQTKLLISALKKAGKKVMLADFPQHGKPSGYFSDKYLRGEYGKAHEVDPYTASLFYSLDRYDKSFEIKKWLKTGGVVICNRYTSANMGHQAGKLKPGKERQKYLKWLEELEYDVMKIPRPDLTFLLFMPPAVAQKLVDGKAKRSYMKGKMEGKKRDIHEKDIKHLRDASSAFVETAKIFHWKVIECARGNTPRAIPEIHDELLKIVMNELK